MGRQEAESRKRARKNQLRDITLAAVQAAGLIGLAVLAPNVVGAMGKLGLIVSPRQKDIVRRTTTRLVRAGFLEWRDSKLRLTTKGERELHLLSLRQHLRKPRRWDGKW